MSDIRYSENLEQRDDFDHLNPNYNQNIYEAWDRMRSKSLVAYSNRYGGTWLPLSHDYISEIAYDTKHFSSASVVVSNIKPLHPQEDGGFMPPITSDPPFHKESKQLLLAEFSKAKATELEPSIRKYCVARLDALEPIQPGQTVLDAAIDYAQHIPVNTMCGILGIPIEDGDLIRSFLKDAVEGANLAPEELEKNYARFDEYIYKQINDRRLQPETDLISRLIKAADQDNSLQPNQLVGLIRLMIVAGIDTVWSIIGTVIWHLAKHPKDLESLRSEPALMSTAIEEFLRAYAPVTMARVLKEDREFHGCPMKKGDWVLLSFPAANRDPVAFEDANIVKLDRQLNRHAAFGLGIHRCIGSHLARSELRIAIEVFINRYKRFELASPDLTTWSTGQVRGPRSLPIRILEAN